MYQSLSPTDYELMVFHLLTKLSIVQITELWAFGAKTADPIPCNLIPRDNEILLHVGVVSVQ